MKRYANKIVNPDHPESLNGVLDGMAAQGWEIEYMLVLGQGQILIVFSRLTAFDREE